MICSATKKSEIRQIELSSQLSSLSDASWRTAERTGALDLERFRLELMALRGEMLADKQLGEALLKAYDEALANHKTAE